MGPVMLMYHSIQPGKGTAEWRWAVSHQRFCDQLDLLADLGWSTTTMSELVANPDQTRERTVVITFDDGYVDNLVAVEELQRRGMCASWFIVTGSIGQSPAWRYEGQPTTRLLNGAELKSMRASDMEIGAHTHSHKRLTELDDATALDELITSRETLHQLLGNAPTSFAYPYGAWNEHCESLVKKAGYLSACTTRPGWSLRDNNSYQLRRLTVFNHDTTSSFSRKLYFGSNDASWSAVLNYALKRVTNR
jgi:peptidoglycan/xylan/chitin deacetylase (PgdA/CDA1 family)